TGTIDAAARRRIGIAREELPADDYERIEELVDLAPIREALVEALETLADEQRDALRLRVIDGLGYPEVAARLGCAEAAARQRVSRGLRRIAMVLQERGLSLATEGEEVDTEIASWGRLEGELSVRARADARRASSPDPKYPHRWRPWVAAAAALLAVSF